MMRLATEKDRPHDGPRKLDEHRTEVITVGSAVDKYVVVQ